MEISFILASRSKKCFWTYSLSSELSNLCENEDLAYFVLPKGKIMQEVYKAAWYYFIIQAVLVVRITYVSYINTVFPHFHSFWFSRICISSKYSDRWRCCCCYFGPLLEFGGFSWIPVNPHEVGITVLLILRCFIFWLNSLQSIIKSATKAKFQSPSVFLNSAWGYFFSFRRI